MVLPYAGYGTSSWVRILGRVVLVRPELLERRLARRDPSTKAREPRIRGWRSFMTVAVSDVPVVVTVGGEEHLLLPDRGGIIDTVVPASLEPGRHLVGLRAQGGEQVTHAPVFVVGDDIDFGIVSDVDDTVMVTALPRPLLAAWNTFVLDEHARVPTPGMAVLYERALATHPASPVVYLSTGAWNVAPTLKRFLSRNLFPSGPLLLTDWGPTHDRLFRSGRQHKVDSLERLAVQYPRIKWLLIGDDGQHDESIYGDFAARHPDNVAAIAIRRLSPSEAVLAGSKSTGEPHAAVEGVPWVYGADGARLFDELARLGIIDASRSRARDEA